LATAYSPARAKRGVPSALLRFTTLFGMGRGSSTASSHQLKKL